MADSQPSKRVRNAKKQKVSTAKWTIEEKQKFVTGNKSVFPTVYYKGTHETMKISRGRG